MQIPFRYIFTLKTCVRADATRDSVWKRRGRTQMYKSRKPETAKSLKLTDKNFRKSSSRGAS